MSEHEDPQSNNMRVPFPPVNRRLTAGVEMFVCPVIGCDWRKTVAEVELTVAHVPIRGSGPTLNDAIGEALVARAKATDAILREHLESHDVVDFVRTIRDLEQQVYNAGYTGVRPHRRTTELAGAEDVSVPTDDDVRALPVTERWMQSYDEALASSKPLPPPPHRFDPAKAAEVMDRYRQIDGGGGIATDGKVV